MSTAQILNLIAIIFCAVSLILALPLLIYLSIALLVASMIYWRIMAGRRSREE
jgi:hypothetical protein